MTSIAPLWYCVAIAAADAANEVGGIQLGCELCLFMMGHACSGTKVAVEALDFVPFELYDAGNNDAMSVTAMLGMRSSAIPEPKVRC